MLAWSAFDLLLCAAGLCAGLLLVLVGLSHRSRGDEPHCAKCDYNLTGAASPICPECGIPRTPETTVHGQRQRRLWLAALGILLALASCTPVPFLFRNPFKNQPTAPRPAGPTQTIKTAKLLIADLKATFKTGQTVKMAAGGGCRPDSRMNILVLWVQDKIKVRIQRCAAPQAVKTAALTELNAADQLLTSQIVPAFTAAVQSRKPADAQAIVPLMDKLDKHMDKLLQILKGY